MLDDLARRTYCETLVMFENIDNIDMVTYIVLICMAIYIFLPLCRSVHCPDYTHRYSSLPV